MRNTLGQFLRILQFYVMDSPSNVTETEIYIILNLKNRAL